MNLNHCDICGSNDFVLIYQDAKDYITNESFQVWQCKKCHVGITWPRPQNLSPYYPEMYRQYNPIIAGLLEALYRQRVKKWTAQFKNLGTVFEMGCGNGTMLEALRKLGWKVMGSERNVHAASIPHDRYGLPVYVGDLNALRPTPHFAFIFLFQVLEHLEDPMGTLKYLISMLNPDGKIIIGVPNFPSWQSKFGREKWFHLDVPRHLWHYSLPTLEIMFDQLGMKKEEVSYQSLEHDPYGWIQSILNRVDHSFNRLTRLLMQLNRPDAVNILHLISAMVIGVISIPLSLLSWYLRKGALIEVTFVKKQ